MEPFTGISAFFGAYQNTIVEKARAQVVFHLKRLKKRIREANLTPKAKSDLREEISFLVKRQPEPKIFLGSVEKIFLILKHEMVGKKRPEGIDTENRILLNLCLIAKELDSKKLIKLLIKMDEDFVE
jgi:hypothetical protein